MYASDILSVAKKYIGYTENPKNSNRTVFGERYGWNGVAWCVIFLWACFAEAGAQSLFYGGQKVASCSALKSYAQKTGQWVTSGYRVGDLVIFDFPGTSAVTDHIGIVEEVSGKTLVTIEGNTSPDDKGSQSNGGGVYRKKRSTSLVNGAFRPLYDDNLFNDKPEGGIKTLKAVTGATANEKTLIKSVQTAVGAIADGEIGAQTMSDIACRLKAITAPVTLAIYSTPVIICPDIKLVASPKAGLKAFANSMNGGFYASGAPCSICVTGGVVKQANSAHAFDGAGYPESVIYRTTSGAFGMARVKNVNALPKNVSWAIGGLGLLNNYAPATEGFAKIGGKDFTDVLRKTNHAMLGVKNNYVYMCYAANKTAADVNALAKKLGLEMAIMLDGGHIAAMNGGESFAKINTAITQYYIVQGVIK